MFIDNNWASSRANIGYVIRDVKEIRGLSSWHRGWLTLDIILEIEHPGALLGLGTKPRHTGSVAAFWGARSEGRARSSLAIFFLFAQISFFRALYYIPLYTSADSQPPALYRVRRVPLRVSFTTARARKT